MIALVGITALATLMAVAHHFVGPWGAAGVLAGYVLYAVERHDG